MKTTTFCRSAVLWILLGVSGLSADWSSQIELGRSLINHGRYQEAARLLEKVRDEADQSGDSKTVAIALNNLGSAYGHLQDVPRTERCFRRAAAIFESLGDMQSSLYPRAGLACIYLTHRQYAAAEATFNQVLDLATRLVGPEDQLVGSVLGGMAWSAFLQGDLKKAVAHSERSLAGVRKNINSDGLDLAWALGNLGFFYQRQGRLEEASRLFTEAIGVLEKLHDPNHPSWIEALQNSGSLELARGHYQEAEALLKRALTLAEARPAADRQPVAGILRDYAQVLRQQGRKSEARKLAARAATLRRQSSREDGSAFVVDVRSLVGRK